MQIFFNFNKNVIRELFQCNTNVIGAKDGGSVIYITIYVSKKNNRENTAGNFKAATILVLNFEGCMIQ